MTEVEVCSTTLVWVVGVWALVHLEGHVVRSRFLRVEGKDRRVLPRHGCAISTLADVIL